MLHIRNPRLQVGFSVSRKVGGAVVRNCVKRRLREQFRRMMPNLKPGLYVIIARPPSARADSKALGASMAYLLRKQRLFLEESKPAAKP